MKSTIILDDFQKRAIYSDEKIEFCDAVENKTIGLSNAIEIFIKNIEKRPDSIPRSITLNAITGAGKTAIMSAFIEELFDKLLIDLNREAIVFWLSPNTGGLKEQSKDKIKREYITSPNVSLLNSSDIKSLKRPLRNGDIVFLGWEETNTIKDGKFVGKIWTGESSNALNKLLAQINKKIIKIVIVDESHRYVNDSKNNSTKVLEALSPTIIINMSATPTETQKCNEEASKVNERIKLVEHNVASTEVRDAGRIRKQVKLLSTGNAITKNPISELLEVAINKRNELEKSFKNELKKYNQPKNSLPIPLILVQLPDKSQDDGKTKEYIENYLEKINWKENIDYAFLLSEKTDTDKDSVKNIAHNNIKLLIFKQAIAVGWDCPRAQILVKYRPYEKEMSSFDRQTIGRILRHTKPSFEDKNKIWYDNDELNYAYVYTNGDEFNIGKLYQDGDSSIIQLRQILKPEFKDAVNKLNALNFISYINKHKKNDLDKDSAVDFIKKQITDFSTEIVPVYKNDIEGIMDAEDMDNIEATLKESKTNKTELIEQALELKYNEICRKLGAGNAGYAEYILNQIFYHYTKDIEFDYSEEDIYRIILNNLNILKPAFDKLKRQNEIRAKKNAEFEEKLFIIKEERDISNPDVENENNPVRIYSKMIYSPTYISSNTSSPEKKFIDKLESNSNVLCWMKNEDLYGPSTKYTEKILSDEFTRITFPDFIVWFKDDNIGIYETKSINDTTENIEEKDKQIQKMAKEKGCLGCVVRLDKDNKNIIWPKELDS